MKCDIWIIFCCVLFSPINVAQKMDYFRHNYYVRDKRQNDEQWSWGYVNKDETGSNIDNQYSKIIMNERTDAPEEENPCDRPDPTMPDFSAPGRRISEQKCYEYIWNIKRREVEIKKSSDCAHYEVSKQMHGIAPAIGGYSAAHGEFPHMICKIQFYKSKTIVIYTTREGAIGWRAAQGTWVFKCGGSLISSKFVLTAAHCTRASSIDTTIADPVPKIVRLGDKNIIDVWYRGYFPKDANISRIIPHPQYKSPKKYFDIALMELEREIEFTSLMQPACLWSSFDTSPLGTKAVFTGWGILEVGSRTISPNLQAGVVDIIDTDQCNVLLQQFCNRLWCGVNDSQICAGKLAGGVDTCQGDSGGPLQVKIPLPKSDEGVMHYVIGVTSFGFSCAVANQPGIYTRVASFVDWIEEVVWPAV